MMKNILLIATLSLGAVIFGCEKAQEKPSASGSTTPVASNPPAPGKPAAPNKEEPGHEGHGRTEEQKPAAAGDHGGEVIPLGTSKLGPFEIRASRDKGDIKASGDAPIDVWVDGGVGKGVTAVRFWVGSQDAKGSVKARAEIEDGKWHTHVEIPSEMPAESKLWVEVEESNGKKSVCSFDLKM